MKLLWDDVCTSFKVSDSVDVILREKGEIEGYGTLIVPGVVIAVEGDGLYQIKHWCLPGCNDVKVTIFPIGRVKKPLNPKRKLFH